MNILKEVSDFVFGAGLFINACLFIPQAWRLYKTKDAEGISLVTFGGFICISLTAVVNGYFYSNWAMVVGYMLTIFSCGVVVGLAAYYKIKHRQRNK